MLPPHTHVRVSLSALAPPSSLLLLQLLHRVPVHLLLRVPLSFVVGSRHNTSLHCLCPALAAHRPLGLVASSLCLPQEERRQVHHSGHRSLLQSSSVVDGKTGCESRERPIARLPHSSLISHWSRVMSKAFQAFMQVYDQCREDEQAIREALEVQAVGQPPPPPDPDAGPEWDVEMQATFFFGKQKKVAAVAAATRAAQSRVEALAKHATVQAGPATAAGLTNGSNGQQQQQYWTAEPHQGQLDERPQQRHASSLVSSVPRVEAATSNNRSSNRQAETSGVSGGGDNRSRGTRAAAAAATAAVTPRTVAARAAASSTANASSSGSGDDPTQCQASSSRTSIVPSPPSPLPRAGPSASPQAPAATPAQVSAGSLDVVTEPSGAQGAHVAWRSMYIHTIAAQVQRPSRMSAKSLWTLYHVHTQVLWTASHFSLFHSCTMSLHVILLCRSCPVLAFCCAFASFHSLAPVTDC